MSTPQAELQAHQPQPAAVSLRSGGLLGREGLTVGRHR